MFMCFPSFLTFLPCYFISRSHALCRWESVKETWAIPYFSKTYFIFHIVSWWSWWESHPCLKSYWTTSLSPYGEMRFGYIYNERVKNWPRKCSLRPLPLRKSLSKKNHARVLVLRYLELLVCELLTNRHHRSSVCRSRNFCRTSATLAHNILTSESLKGKLP